MARLAKEKAVGAVFPGEGNMRSSTAMVGDERWTENSVVPKLGGGRRVTDGRSTMGGKVMRGRREPGVFITRGLEEVLLIREQGLAYLVCDM